MSRVAHTGPAPAPIDSEERERARLDLALAAARSERRNRPTYLLVLALVVVAAAGVMLIWALGARASAEIALRNERGAARDYAKSAARLDQLRSTTADKSPFPVNSDDRIRSRIQAAAERAGMTSEPAGMTAPSALLPQVSTDPRKPGSTDGSIPATQRSKFRYDNVKQASLETLLKWLNYAVEDIPGLEVYSITLKPEANGWNLQSVTFTRWERVSP